MHVDRKLVNKFTACDEMLFNEQSLKIIQFEPKHSMKALEQSSIVFRHNLEVQIFELAKLKNVPRHGKYLSFTAFSSYR